MPDHTGATLHARQHHQVLVSDVQRDIEATHAKRNAAQVLDIGESHGLCTGQAR